MADCISRCGLLFLFCKEDGVIQWVTMITEAKRGDALAAEQTDERGVGRISPTSGLFLYKQTLLAISSMNDLTTIRSSIPTIHSKNISNRLFVLL